ncbi:P63C domain-containing protein [uncultured Bacteroides sp.]|uniref:P63C domain-containing protein n=1 Tax=uncultured Bacteroides sp. TaxID=162156 RepID=UPI00259AADAD|nr:P63C domain-containing protein [uncultured Bacteroides sp.]
MEENKILVAKYGSDKTPLRLGNLEIPCYVLDNGVRVFSGRGIQKAIGYDSKSGQWMNSFCKMDGVSSYLCAGDNSISERLSKPIKFKRNNAGGSQSTANGYEVTILVDICSAIIDANRAGVFNNDVIVQNADIIIRSVAKVGIIALVDEATGYQHDRENDELQKILKAYISEELLPWQKRFPDIFYKELFRLNGWDYTVNGIKKRPGIIGKWTNTFVYEELPNGVLEELKKKTPKSESGNRTNRYHQLLTTDIGEPNLEKQINKVITLFQVSDNMKQFCENFRKMKMRQIGQSELPFEFDENGRIKE